MFTLILSVIAALVVSADSEPLLKLKKGCGELQACLKPLFNDSFGYGFMFSETIRALSDKSRHDEFCQKKNELKACYSNNKLRCNNYVVKESVFIAENLAEFICSAAGKEGLDKVANSVCLTDEAAYQEVQDSVAKCFEDYQSVMERIINNKRITVKNTDFCSHLSQLSCCLSQSFLRHCDRRLAKFTRKIEETGFEPLRMGCCKEYFPPPEKEKTYCDAQEKCTNYIKEVNFNVYEGGVSVLFEQSQRKRLCQHIKTEFSTCLDKTNATCSEAFWEGVKRSSAFLETYCSNETKGELDSLKGTRCFTNESECVKHLLRTDISRCVENSKQEVLMASFMHGSIEESTCRAEDQKGRCINASLARHCGSDLASLADKLWDFNLASTSNVVCRNRNSLSSQDCDDLLACLNPLYPYGFDGTYAGSLDVLHNLTRLGELCQKSADFKTCYTNTKDKCKSSVLLTTMATSVEMNTYLCSKLVQGGLKLLTDSPCVKDKEAFRTAANLVNTCVISFAKDLEDRLATGVGERKQITSLPICAHLDDEFGLQFCIANTLRTTCGKTFSYFGQKLKNIADRPLAKVLGCDQRFKKIPEECESLATCLTPLHDAGFEETYEETLSVLSDQQKYNGLCQLNSDFQSCYNEKKVQCRNDRVFKKISHLAQTLGHLCSPEGQEDLQNIADSPCIKNATAQFKSRLGAQECHEKFDKDLSYVRDFALTAGEDLRTFSLCPLFAKESECIIESMRKDCGANFTTVGKKLWHIQHLPRQDEFRCDDQFRLIPDDDKNTVSGCGCIDLIQCFSPLKKFGHRIENFTARFSIILDNLEYDEICDAYDRFHCCYSEKKDACKSSSTVNFVNGIVDLLSHLCTSFGRSGLRQIGCSECTANVNIKDKVKQSLGQCIENFNKKNLMATYYSRAKGDNPESFNYCPVIGELNMCIATSLGKQCTKQFAAYINKIWKLHVSPFLNLFGCDGDLRKINSSIWLQETALNDKLYGGQEKLTATAQFISYNGIDKGCDELETCSKLIPKPISDTQLATGEVYEKICQNYAKLQACYQEKKDKCGDSFRSSAQLAAAEMADYICSAEGHKAHRLISTTQCITDSKARRGVQEALSECADAYQLDLEMEHHNSVWNCKAVNICHILDNHLKCYTTAAAEYCGKPYAAYTNRLWHIGNDHYVKNFGCELAKKTDKPVAAGCDRLRECKSSVYTAGFRDAYDWKLGLLINKTKYVGVCQQFWKPLQDCYNRSKASCKDLEEINDIVRLLDFLDYLCVDRLNFQLGHAPLLELTLYKSECSKDDKHHHQLQKGVKTCLLNYEIDVIMAQHEAKQSGQDAESINVCPAIEQQRDCVFDTVKSHCDKDFFSVASDFWYIDFMQTIAAKGCTDHACDELKKCRTLLDEKSNTTFDVNDSPAALTEYFKGFCQRNQAFQTCLRLKPNGCADNNLQYMYSSSKNLVEQLCTDIGNPLYREAIKSPCVASSTNLLHAERTAEECLQSYERKSNKHRFKGASTAETHYKCLLLQSVYDCGQNALISHCGKPYASLAWQLWGETFVKFKNRAVCNWNAKTTFQL